MMKNVLVSYITEAENDLDALYIVNNALQYLPMEESIKFTIFHVEDVVKN